MRIAIVNDRNFTVKVLQRLLSSFPQYEIAWVAYNGQEAVEKCSADTPDLILMDLYMPVMDGVEAIRQIMQQSPCAILIVTGSVAGNDLVFEGLGNGALDVVKTPELDRLENVKIHDSIELLDKISRINMLLSETEYIPYSPEVHQEVPPLIAIGAAMGGPKSIATLLSGLPQAINASIVIIQQLDEQYGAEFAHWLQEQTPLTIQLAADGSRLRKGTVLIAGTNDHLVMTPKCTLHYTPHPLDRAYRPSIDVFFKSLAEFYPLNSAAILLTGMGKDGASGLKALHDKGWYTIVEHSSTCISDEMPKAAIQLEAVTEVLPVDQIAPSLIAYLRSAKGKG